MAADPDLLAGWLRARSVARGIVLPVADRGGWRVDTRQEAESGRYVFAAPAPGLIALGQGIDRPRMFLKLCDDDHILQQLLPAHWEIQASSWMMTGPSRMPDAALPEGYCQQVDRVDGSIRIRIVGPNGALAASGYAAEAKGVFVYDRIVTAAEHQRRGLGRVVMTQLAQQRQSSASCQVLVASAEGRALYTVLGWEDHAPFASAVIPDRVASPPATGLPFAPASVP